MFPNIFSQAPIATGPAISGSGPVSQDSAFGPVNIGGLFGSGASGNSTSPVVLLAGIAAVSLVLFFALKK